MVTRGGGKAHPVRGVLRGEEGFQVVAAQHARAAPVHGGGLHLQEPHRDVAVQKAQPLQQEPPAPRVHHAGMNHQGLVIHSLGDIGRRLWVMFCVDR